MNGSVFTLSKLFSSDFYYVTEKFELVELPLIVLC